MCNGGRDPAQGHGPFAASMMRIVEGGERLRGPFSKRLFQGFVSNDGQEERCGIGRVTVREV